MNRPSFRRFCSLDENGKPHLILLDDFSEELFCHFENIEFSFSEKSSEGIGDLYFTSGRIIWVEKKIDGQKENVKSFDFDVPFIILHALTHDLNIFNKPFASKNSVEWS